MSINELNQIYTSFQTQFPIEKLKSLTLEEYTNLDRDNSFCYWLETKTESLGSIWGGSAYKFGIFRIAGDIKPSNKAKNDGVYAWYTKYGDDAKTAYSAILKNIIAVAEAAQSHNFQLIDSIDLGPSYKWKIAFLYSNNSLLNIYAQDGLRYLSKKYGLENYKKAKISELQAFLISKAEGKDLFEFSNQLWTEWLSSDEYKKQNDKELENDNEVSEIDNKSYSIISKIPKKFICENFSESEFSKQYIKSLLTKPFTILAGNSGTGKTQIAKQLADYLGVTFSETKSFQTGQIIDGWMIKKISEDTIYLTNDKEPARLRPIQKDLLNEFVEYYSKNPDRLSQRFAEDREIIRDSENAKFDKFVYGYDATLKVLAKEVIESKYDVYKTETNTIANKLIVPVGSDWTDNTKILGFYNPLKKTYESTKILDFILLACDNPEIPFFLILDEMNLSHVERYFSDFLSAMESHEKIILYSKDEDCDSDIPESIDLPENLFVTGTVNIDETTYMFSPKVLDRANVIEFIPAQSDVLANFAAETQPVDIEPVNDGSAEGFLELAKTVRETTTLPAGSDICKTILEGISNILDGSGFEFAFRTAKEIRLYINAAYALAQNDEKTLSEEDYVNLMDEQLLQKVLPKVHGNRSQVGTLLSNLSKYSEEQNLKESKKKIDRMLKQLETSQFTSFI